ncbi:MAG: DUF2510 domain-containing protein [Actinomycetaceae bacterium]|nr:DUF2510 domain-containing protein [Actinomycetaceae bacterium]
MSNPIPGWYPDPDNGTRHRYWDGDAWTENIRYDLEFVNADEDEIIDDDAYEDADMAFEADSYGAEDSSFSSYEGGAVTVDEPAFISPDVPTFDSAPSAVEDASQAPGAAALQEVWKRPKWLKGAAAAAGAVTGRISEAQAPEEPEFPEAPEAPEAPGFPTFGVEDPQATAVFDAGVGAGPGAPGVDETNLSIPAVEAPSFGGRPTFPAFGAQAAPQAEAFVPEESTFEAPTAPALPQQTQPVWPQETSTSAWSALLRRTEPQDALLPEVEEPSLEGGLWEGEGADEVPEEESGPSFGLSLPTSKLSKKSPLRRGLAGATGLFGRARDALGGDEGEAPTFESPEFGDAGEVPSLGDTDLGTASLGTSDITSDTFGVSGFGAGRANADFDAADLGGSEGLDSTDFGSVEAEAAGFDTSGVDASGLGLTEVEAPEGEFELPELPGNPLKAASGLRSALGRTPLFGRKRDQEDDVAPGATAGGPGIPVADSAAPSTDTEFLADSAAATPWIGSDRSLEDDNSAAGIASEDGQETFPSSRPGLTYPDDRHGAPAVETTTPAATKTNPWQVAVLATSAALLLVVIAIIGVLIHSATLGPRLEDARAKLNEAQQSVVDAQNELTQAEQESGGSQ